MNDWIESANTWLLRTTLEGSVLILTVLGLSWLLGGRLTPRWRVVLWSVVGLKLLVPAFFPHVPGFGNWWHEVSLAGAGGMVASDLSASITPSVNEVASGDPFEVDGEIAPVVWFSMLWTIGFVCFLLTLWWKHHVFTHSGSLGPCRNSRLLGLVRRVSAELELRREFRVMLGPEGATPAVYGVRETCLILPGDWERRFDEEVLRHVLMHEMEHIRHRDILLNWLAAAVNAVHWFNPLVWIAVARFQADREMRCDALALSRMRPEERINYGRTLLRVQREFLPAPATAGVAPCVRNHPTLRQRILMITNPTRRNAWLNALLVPGLAGIMAVSFGSATADERPSREGDQPREGDRDRPREEGRGREGDRREGDRPREEGRGREGDRREGERPREEGRGREGERREGDRPREGERPGPHPGEVALFVVRDGVRLGDRFIPMSHLRGEFSKLEARSAIVSAEGQIPFFQVNEVVDALKDVGIRDVRIGNPMRPPHGEGGPREGDRPRPEGAPREGDRPRPEGAPRDGDRPRPEGAPRDGDRPRPEGAPREGDRPRPEGAPRDGDRPRPEGAPRDGDRPRPEGAPRDGDRPRPEGAPRDGDRPRPEGERGRDA